MELQKDYLEGEAIETVYFGGGTPSLLPAEDIRKLFARLAQHFRINKDAEITLEANPDDITEEKLSGWKAAGINRLSIGIQSFFDDDLAWMNRAHSGQQAAGCLGLAKKYFENITIDLIYGTPLLTNEKWKSNVDTVVRAGIPHLSCYALTVEPKTPLDKMIRLHKKEEVNPDQQSEQFLLLMQWMQEAGYEHYEISNFAKPGWRSRHNSSYWQGKKYLGLGPSAHSYNGTERQWNISNNTIYITALEKGELSFEKEVLTATQKLNEYIMTALRTKEGLDLEYASKNFGVTEKELREKAKTYLDRNLLQQTGRSLVLTNEGKLLADGIAATLFC